MKMASRSIHLISKKTLHVQHTFFLIRKKQICTCSTLFGLSLPLFCTTTTLFCTTKASNFLVTHYFYGGRNCRMCLPNILFPVFMFTFFFFFFFTGPHLHPTGRSLLAASISNFLTAALNFHVFLPTEFVSFVFNHSL